MTDRELKIELCKLLPEEIEYHYAPAKKYNSPFDGGEMELDEEHNFCWAKFPDDAVIGLIRDTEWLEICHRIEKRLLEIKNGAANFIINLHGVTNAMDAESTAEELWRISQATWQQRAEALVKTFKEIK